MAGKMKRFTFWENYYLPLKRIKDRGKRAELALKLLEHAFEGGVEFDDMEGLMADAITPLIEQDMGTNKGGRPKREDGGKPGENIVENDVENPGEPAVNQLKTPGKTSFETGFETGFETSKKPSLTKRSEAKLKGKTPIGFFPLASEEKKDAPSGAAAGRAQPLGAQGRCPKCGGKLFRNAQTGKHDCGSCLESFTAQDIDALPPWEPREEAVPW